MAIRPQGVAVNPSCTASTFANSNGTVSVINTLLSADAGSHAGMCEVRGRRPTVRLPHRVYV